jgi:hypothetical protein
VPAHIVFLIAGCAFFTLTFPAILFGWVRRLPARRLAVTYYSAGYAIMATGYVLDTVTTPPLFVHGFVAGLGVAQVIIALVLVAPLPEKVGRGVR